MMISMKTILPLLLAVVSASSREDAADESTKKSLRGVPRKLSTNPPPPPPPLGPIQNLKEPTWLTSGGVGPFQTANSHLAPADAIQAHGKHIQWRNNKFPLPGPEASGVKQIFDDGVIEEIVNDNDASDTRTIRINPHKMCDYDGPDIETGFMVLAETMVSNDVTKYKVYMDVDELKLSDLASPSCDRKWKGLYDTIEPSRYPLKMEKIVAYPVSYAKESVARAVLSFSGTDATMHDEDVVVATNTLEGLSNKLGFPQGEVNAAGGVKQYISQKKRGIVPSTP